jgi:hypothetical protein
MDDVAAKNLALGVLSERSNQGAEVVPNLVQSEFAAQNAAAGPASPSAPPGQGSVSFASLLQMITGGTDLEPANGGTASATSDGKTLSAKPTASGRMKSANAQSPGPPSPGSSAQASGASPAPMAVNTALAFSAIELPTDQSAIELVTSLEPHAAPAAPDGSLPGLAITAIQPSARGIDPTACLETDNEPGAPDWSAQMLQPATLDQVQAGYGSASTVEASLLAPATPVMKGAVAALNPSLATENWGSTTTADSVPGDAEAKQGAVAQASPANRITPAVPTPLGQAELFAEVNPASGASASMQPFDLGGLALADKGQISEVMAGASAVMPSKPQPQSAPGSATVSGMPFLSAAATKLASSLPFDSSSRPSGFALQAELASSFTSGSRTVTPPVTVIDPNHSDSSRHDPASLPSSHTGGTADASPSNPPLATEPGATTAPLASNPQADAGARGDGATPTALAAMATSGAQEPATQTSGGATVERPAQPAGEVGVTQAASADPVQAARIVNGALQSEMHIGLRTQAFGSVEVHTVVRENQLGLTVGSEKGNLRGFLNSEVPALQTAFRQQDLRFETIRFLEGSPNAGSALSGGANQQSRSFRQGSTEAGESASASEALEALAEENLSFTENTKLSVLA